MRLSPEQRAATDLDRNVALVAGAGSGKTRVLVARYVAALESGAPVSSILCVTFTEKAAAEMLERLRAELARRAAAARDAPEDAGDPERWTALTAELRAARIGTLHGTCARLLRENADACGLDPQFEIASGIDRTLLFRDAVDRVLAEQPAGPVARERAGDLAEAVALLSSEAGRFRMLGWLERLLGHRERVAPHADRLLRGDPRVLLGEERALLAELERTCWSRVPKLRALATWAPLLQESLASATQDDNGAPFRSLCRGLLDLAASDEADRDAVRSIGQGILSSLASKSGAAKSGFKRLLKTAGVDVDPCNEALVAIARGVIGCVRPVLDGFHDRHEELALGRGRAIARLVRAVLDRYDALKSQDGVLDFDDLERLALRLLRTGPVIDRYRHVLVDEFQDTNRVQWGIIRHLAPVDGPELADRGIFIVGDPVQSIYAFRDAEVAVFGEASAALRLRGGEGDRLRESYRSLPRLVRFVNAWFERLLVPERRVTSDEPDYEPLVAMRAPVAPAPGDADADAAPFDGRVEVLAACPPPDAPTRLTADESRAVEAELIARRIVALVEPERLGLPDEHPLRGRVTEPAPVAPGAAPVEQLRRARYRDVAILLRGRTALASFEEALHDHGVPYVVMGGIALYQSPEVRDLTSLLMALLDPRDDYAHLGLYRGPFVGLSDAALVVASRLPGSSLRARVEELRARSVAFVAEALEAEPLPAPLSSADHAALAALPDLDAWRRRLELGPLAEAIRSFCDESGAWASFAAGPWGVRAVGNVEKAIGIAREEDRRGLWDARRFAARLGLLVGEGVAESEAPSIEWERSPEEGGDDEGPDAVRILTIHAAKGLEFPIVIVPELHRRFQADFEDFAVHGELGLGVRAPHPGHAFAPAPSVRQRLIRVRQRAAGAAEEKRILYVAATRARDHLCLSLLPTEDVSRIPLDESWEDWLARDLGVTRDTIGADDHEELDAAGGVLVLPEELPPPLPASARGLAEDIQTPLPAQIETLQAEIAPLPAPPGEVRLSPTRLKVLADCPRRYAYRYLIGLEEYAGPSARPAEAIVEGDEEEDALADPMAAGALAPSPFAFGTLVHRAIELALGRRYPLPLGPLFGAPLRRSLAAEYPAASPDDLARAIAVIDALPEDPVGAELCRASERRLEVPIRLQVAGAWIEGSIDAMHRREDGTLRILDHKTDRRLSGILERYRLPMLIYGVAARRALGEAEVELGLYTTANPSASPFYPPMDALAERRAIDELTAIVRSLPPRGAQLDDFELKEVEPGGTRRMTCGHCGYFQARICPVAIDEGAEAPPRGLDV